MAAVAEGLVRPRRRWRNLLEEKRVLGPLLIAPAVIFVLIVVGVPLAWSLYLSLTDATGGSLSGKFVGLDNFTEAWHDQNFRTALENTLIITFSAQVIVVIGAAVLSHFLVRDFRGKWFVRFLVILPWAAPVALVTILWLWIFDSLFSVVNWTLKETHTIGAVCSLAVGLKWRLGFDDSLDVVGVHMVGGLVGCLFIGFFGTSKMLGADGLFYGGGTTLLGHQALGAFSVLFYSLGVTLVLGFLLEKTIGFRISKDAEVEGIDLTEHAETA